MPERILTRLVEVELVMRVLDQRHRKPVRDEARDQLLDERRLAAAGPAGESEYAHRGLQCCPMTEVMNSRLA